MKVFAPIIAILAVLVFFALPSSTEHEGRNSESWLVQLNSSSASDRRKAVSGLAGLVRSEEANRNPLQRLAVGCGDTLGLRSSGSPALNGILTALSDPEEAVRAQAVDSLAGLGPIAVPALRDAIARGETTTLRGIKAVLAKAPNALEGKDVVALDGRLTSAEPAPSTGGKASEPATGSAKETAVASAPTQADKDLEVAERERRIREIMDDPNLTSEVKASRAYQERLGWAKVEGRAPHQ